MVKQKLGVALFWCGDLPIARRCLVGAFTNESGEVFAWENKGLTTQNRTMSDKKQQCHPKESDQAQLFLHAKKSGFLSIGRKDQ